MVWTTNDGRQIDIDTYTDTKHLINICKFIGDYHESMTLQELRDAINEHIEHGEFDISYLSELNG